MNAISKIFKLFLYTNASPNDLYILFIDQIGKLHIKNIIQMWDSLSDKLRETATSAQMRDEA